MNYRLSVLVTGGAGYVGSVLSYLLHEAGYAVTIVDHAPLPHLPEILQNKVTYISADYADEQALLPVLEAQQFCAVMHLAAYIEVGESVKDPARYYYNNVSKTIQLLDIMRKARIPFCIAASSCAVYGSPQSATLSENHPCVPESPYGRTKLMMEWILRDYETAYGMRYAALRYCNVSGALPDLLLGERHEPETHLIPRAIEAAVEGKPFTVSGTDYPTPDGSCVRDFVHVVDVAQAHLAALGNLLKGGDSVVCTLGSGTGTSVLELLAAIEKEMGCIIQKKIGQRRAGDPSALVADITTARRTLQWEPRASTLTEIVSSAIKFYFNSKINKLKLKNNVLSTCYSSQNDVL